MRRYIYKTKYGELGFTIIELLVVISIIGILAVMALVGLKSARGKAQDVQRHSDLRSTVNALEEYAGEHNEKYVNTNGEWQAILPNSRLASALFPDGKLPKDPAGNAYTYSSDGDCYILRSTMSDQKIHSVSNGTCGNTVPDDYPTDPVEDKISPVWREEFRNALNLIVRPSNKVTVLWGRAFDDSGYVNYRISYREKNTLPWSNLSDIFEGTEVILSDKITLDPSKDYEVRIIARDGSGNISPDYAVTEINLSNADDNNAPYDFSWDCGTNPASPNKIDCDLNWPVQDDENAVRIVYRYKGKDTTNPWMNYFSDNHDSVISYLPGLYKDKEYEVQLVAIDSAGNYDHDSRIVTSTHPSGDTQGDVIEPYFPNGTANNVKIIKKFNKYYVTWQPAGDNIGIKNYKIKVTGQNVPGIQYNIPIGSTSVEVNGMVSGQPYTFDLHAYDYAGNESDDGSSGQSIAP